LAVFACGNAVRAVGVVGCRSVQVDLLTDG